MSIDRDKLVELLERERTLHESRTTGSCEWVRPGLVCQSDMTPGK